MENYLIMCFYAFSNVSGILYLTPKTYREQYDFIIHKKESYFELLVIFKSWLHWIYSFLSCPSAKIPTLKKLTFVPFCITTHKWLIQLHSKCRKKGKYILGKWFLINMSQLGVLRTSTVESGFWLKCIVDTHIEF